MFRSRGVGSKLIQGRVSLGKEGGPPEKGKE